MRTAQVLVAGVALLLANFVGIYVGFMAYFAARPSNQIAIQLPIAVVLSVVLYLAFSFASTCPSLRRFQLNTTLERLAAYGASLFLTPAVFIPLHYATQGYLAHFSNLLALIIFQVPVNAIAILVSTRILRRRVKARA